jgi:signal transduction histidine kinase
VTGYVVIKRDTTLRRRMESQEQQRQKIESMGQLADGIAHELHRPMQQLGDNLRFLRDSFGHLDRLLGDLATLAEGREPLAPSALAGVLQFADVDFLRREVGQALAQSSVGVQQMADIVQATRAISGAGAGESLVDLNRAIQSTVIVSSGEWRQVAEVRTLFDAALPEVKCAPADISLVILNLLVVSAQEVAAANPSGIRGKGLITVSTRPVQQWAEIRIHRSGPTVTPEARRQFFDPQAQDPAAPTDPSMALAHDIIVRRHGGSIALESEPGRGTSFVIRLPISSEASSASTAAA